MTETQKRIIAAAYLVVAITTFGHSASRGERWRDVNCQTLTDRVNSPGISCYRNPAEAAAFAAVFWPLYWSWEAFSD